MRVSAVGSSFTGAGICRWRSGSRSWRSSSSGVRRRREHGVGLEPQKLRPGGPYPPWRRAEPAFFEHRGDGRGRDVDAELQELPSDPQVAPPGVLPAQPKDQVLDRERDEAEGDPVGASPARLFCSRGPGAISPACPGRPGNSSTAPGTGPEPPPRGRPDPPW
jgi:hypothetical protein